MSENDNIKRELRLARLQSEEARNDVKMAQGRAEQLNAQLEGYVHEASISELINKRKDRQLGEYKAQVETERRKAEFAVESEKEWRAQMEEMSLATQAKIEEAKMMVAQSDARYSAVHGYYKDKEKRLEGQVAQLAKNVKSVVSKRKEDEMTRRKLEQLCEQQAQTVATMTKERDDMARLLIDYMATKEDSLKEIITKAAASEIRAEDLLEQLITSVGKAKWVVAVKRDVRDAK